MPVRGANPRFVVTSLSTERIQTRLLYEQFYCARGDMENRIKECQLDLFSDRTSAHTIRCTLRSYYLKQGRFLSCIELKTGGIVNLSFPGCNRNRENGIAQIHPHRRANLGARAAQSLLRYR